MSTTETDDALRLSAPAPDDGDDDGSVEARELQEQAGIQELCVSWVHWCRTRNFYVKPSLPVSLLGRLTAKGTGRSSSGGPDAFASAELMAFHLAFLAQPEEALDRKAFALHYFHGVRNVKAAAAELG